MNVYTTLLTAFLVAFVLNTTCQEINRDRNTNELKMEVAGGTQGFEDEAFIHFREGATTGYDPELEAIKWYSPDPQATMIWTVASDGTNLAINKLPLEDLHTNLNSIPLQFVCGYGGGEYTLTFSEVETFDANVELWLADLLTNPDEWINIMQEPVYTFTGLPDDPAGRFNIYILDPAILTSAEAMHPDRKQLRIYSDGNKVYIKNHTEYTIDKLKIYDLSGRAAAFETVSRSENGQVIQIKGQTNCYIVCLLAGGRLYTKKTVKIY